MIRVKPAGGPRHGTTPAPGPTLDPATALGSGTAPDPGPALDPGSALRLAILGDSSAAGFGAPDHATALAGQLSEALAALTGRAVAWRVSARGGATARTAAALLPGLGDPAAGWHPELVLVVIGVNDTTRLRRPAAFRRDIANLVTAIRNHLAIPAHNHPATTARDHPTAPTHNHPAAHHAVDGASRGETGPIHAHPSAPVREQVGTAPGGRPESLIPVLLAGLPPMHRFPGLPAPARLLLGSHARRLDRRLASLAGELPATYHLPAGDLPLDQPGLFAADGFHPAPAAYQVWGRLLAAQAAPLLP